MDDLRKWFDSVENHKSNIVDLLVEGFSKVLNTTNAIEQIHDDKNIEQTTKWLLNGNILQKERNKKYGPDESREGQLDLTLENERFEGCLDPFGNGHGILKTINGINGLYEYLAQGNFVNWQLDGKVKERKSCTFIVDCFYSKGIRHGPYRKFDVSKKYVEVGYFVDGYTTGPFCSKYSGGCYVIGQRTSVNVLESCFFIYPNLEHAIYGKFALCQTDKSSAVRIIEGRFVRIIGLSWDGNFPFAVTETTNSEPLEFEQSTDAIICQHLSLPDPYEEDTVFVATSKESKAGEGLFAKKFIPAGRVVCFFNGVRYLKRRSERGKSYKPSEYRVSLDKFTDLDIPRKYSSLKDYKATLGHKACHSFDERKINVKFENFQHPRFGEIIGLVTICDINTGDEILVNYNYKNIQKAPEWYKSLWKSHKAQFNRQE